jgi:hypothetical protein
MYIKCKVHFRLWGVGMAQSIQRRALGWTAGVRFPAGEGKDFSLIYNVQTGS